jgi:maleate isomerase
MHKMGSVDNFTHVPVTLVSAPSFMGQDIIFCRAIEDQAAPVFNQKWNKEKAIMSSILPTARLGVILSSGNRTVEPYFRAFSPIGMGIHVTRMRMGSGGRRASGDIEGDAIACADLLADASVDAIDLQATGIMMERGPEGETQIVRAIETATGIPAYTATQAVVEALRALKIERVVLIHPMDEMAYGREKTYLEALGFNVIHAAGLGLGEGSSLLSPADWLAAAQAEDRKDGDGFFMSGSYTTMLEGIAPIEETIGKPVVTSIQAALWAGTRRLKSKIGDYAPPSALGRLFGVT